MPEAIVGFGSGEVLVSTSDATASFKRTHAMQKRVAS